MIQISTIKEEKKST